MSLILDTNLLHIDSEALITVHGEYVAIKARASQSAAYPKIPYIACLLSGRYKKLLPS